MQKATTKTRRLVSYLQEKFGTRYAFCAYRANERRDIVMVGDGLHKANFEIRIDYSKLQLLMRGQHVHNMQQLERMFGAKVDETAPEWSADKILQKPKYANKQVKNLAMSLTF